MQGSKNSKAVVSISELDRSRALQHLHLMLLLHALRGLRTAFPVSFRAASHSQVSFAPVRPVVCPSLSRSTTMPPKRAKAEGQVAAPPSRPIRKASTAVKTNGYAADADDLTPELTASEKEEYVDQAVQSVLARRRGQKRGGAGATKPIYTETSIEDDEGVKSVAKSTPEHGKSRKRVAPVRSPEESELSEADTAEIAESVPPAETPKKKGGRKKKAAEVEADEEDDGATPAKKKKAATPKKPTPKKSRIGVKDEPEYDEDGNEVVKKKKRVKVYPKVVYDIPPVERRETTFRGQSRHCFQAGNRWLNL